MKNKKPFITIITPTYNRADLIWLAIESVINQKRDVAFDRELLIIDDWSKDNTKNIIEWYIKKHPKNIKYFWQRNSWIPGVARNVWLDNMNKNSDYTIFLDSDDELVSDCIHTCIKKWKELKNKDKYNQYLWLTYYCKTQHGKIVWSKKILNWKESLDLSYKTYLSGEIYWEWQSIIKSDLFLNNKDFRFEKDIVNEGVLWSKLRKLWYKLWKHFLLLNYIWRIYRIEYWSNQITKSINPERFKKNAIGNERIIDVIWSDLLKFWYKKSYAEYLFKAWINWILYRKKKDGLRYLKKSLKYHFSFKVFWLHILSIFSRNIVLFLYKTYI